MPNVNGLSDEQFKRMTEWLKSDGCKQFFCRMCQQYEWKKYDINRWMRRESLIR